MESTAKEKWLQANPTLLKATDVSRLLGCHSQTVYRMASQKVIPSLKIGKSRRFRATDVLAYVEANGEKF